MARKFKLNAVECASIINEHALGVPVETLGEKYFVSPATIYRVLSGEYTSRLGVSVSVDLHPTLAELLNSPGINLDVPLNSLDPMTQAAANLVVAQGRFSYALGHPKH